jgi:alanine racemase
LNDILSQIDTENLLIHSSNTAATIAFPHIDYNMARAGIGIYGYVPDLPEGTEPVPKLIPAMSIKGRITNIHTAPENDGVSYCHLLQPVLIPQYDNSHRLCRGVS